MRLTWTTGSRWLSSLMLPMDFQDYVFQWSDGKMQFKELKDKVADRANAYGGG